MADLGTSRRVGKYDLLELVGKGGMGEVWKARDGDLDRIVALKLMQISSMDHLLRFRREAHVVATLNHPHIAQLYEFSAEPPYLAMQFIDGVAIQMFVPEGGGVVPARARALRDAARALHHAHERRILHRDVKPGNILVDRGGDAYVVDFGLAREVKPADTGMTLPGDVLGTPSYMAPEQARGEVATIGPWTDVYGLGATLYTILCGRPPHSAPTPMGTIQSVIAGDSVRPGGDRDLETICLKAMEHDPRRRYPTAAAMADDIDRYLRNEPIEARRPSIAYRVRKRIQRQPVVWTLAGLLLAAVAGGGWFGVDQLIESRRNLAAALEWEEIARSHYERALREAESRRPGQTGRTADLYRREREAVLARHLEGDALTAASAGLAEMEALHEAVDLAPDDPVPLLNLGAAHASLGMLREAERDFSEALDRDPGHPTALKNRGAVRQMLGDPDGALEDFEEFLRRAPDDPRAPQVQAWIDDLRRGREF